jgi:glutathione synthase/RimK-type ligase-like ATP-grasp enzyme
VKLRIATCKTLPEPDADEAPLAAALAAAGIDAPLVAWDDPAAAWDAPVPTLLRSTWNYALNLDAFLAWVDRASAVAPLLNPADVVRDNVHKRYLLDLNARGVPVVPTRLYERGDHVDATHLHAISSSELGRKIVIKPEVGAGSLNAKVFTVGEQTDAAVAHLCDLTTTGAALVQPYVASVDDYGERSLIWIDGELTHAIRKTPRFSGDRERTEGPFPIADDERAVATAALAAYADRIFYGRVDLVRDGGGQPMVMELELVEPSLFFSRHPPALDRFVAGLRRWLSSPGGPRGQSPRV